jgi:hypothetical protein
MVGMAKCKHHPRYLPPKNASSKSVLHIWGDHRDECHSKDLKDAQLLFINIFHLIYLFSLCRRGVGLAE